MLDAFGSSYTLGLGVQKRSDSVTHAPLPRGERGGCPEGATPLWSSPKRARSSNYLESTRTMRSRVCLSAPFGFKLKLDLEARVSVP